MAASAVPSRVPVYSSHLSVQSRREQIVELAILSSEKERVCRICVRAHQFVGRRFSCNEQDWRNVAIPFLPPTALDRLMLVINEDGARKGISLE